jgi:hypothetical protein
MDQALLNGVIGQGGIPGDSQGNAVQLGAQLANEGGIGSVVPALCAFDDLAFHGRAPVRDRCGRGGSVAERQCGTQRSSRYRGASINCT